MIDIELFIKLLKVQTVSRNESRMIKFILDYLDANFSDIEITLDDYNNILVKKGETENYPCVIAHIDTVHDILPEGEEITVKYNDNKLYGVNNITNEQVGIGGDDKCGIYYALHALNEFENIKIALFVEEEIGCNGSRRAEASFFSNVGYFIQLDAPFNNLVSYNCSGTQLFHEEGEFFNIISKHLYDTMGEYELAFHPYTDVQPMRERFNMQAINFSAAYYNMHTPYEYIRLDEFSELLKMVDKIIYDLGEKKYPFTIDN